MARTSPASAALRHHFSASSDSPCLEDKSPKLIITGICPLSATLRHQAAPSRSLLCSMLIEPRANIASACPASAALRNHSLASSSLPSFSKLPGQVEHRFGVASFGRFPLPTFSLLRLITLTEENPQIDHRGRNPGLGCLAIPALCLILQALPL